MNRSTRTARSDGEQTRVRLLEAAGKLFAAGGYAETTGKAIAAEAEVDLASINYHFGGRSGLYQAVLVEAHRRLVTLLDLQKIAASDLPATAKFRSVIETLVAGSAEGAWHTRVLARELLAPSSHLQVLFREEVAPKFAVVKGIISELTGIPETDPALLRCMVSVAAPCAMLLLVAPNMPGPFEEVLHAQRRTLAADLHAFLLGGLQALSHAYAGSPARKKPTKRTPRPHG